MKKVTLLFIALWGVLSGGIYAQSSLPRIMLKVTGELSNDKRVSAVFTLEQTDEATGSTTTETYYTFGCTWNGCHWDEKPQLKGANTLHFVRPFSHLTKNDNLGFLTSLAERWAELRDDVLSIESVSKIIDDYAQQLDESGAWQRERELWNYNPVTTDETAAEAAKYMTEWYANGHEAISQLLEPYLPTEVKDVKSESKNNNDACYDLQGRPLPLPIAYLRSEPLQACCSCMSKASKPQM